jgi:hypothetical protein
MPERSWEVVPCCGGLVRERAFSVRFCSSRGYAKNSSSLSDEERRLSRRSVDRTKFREVFRQSKSKKKFCNPIYVKWNP